MYKYIIETFYGNSSVLQILKNPASYQNDQNDAKITSIGKRKIILKWDRGHHRHFQICVLQIPHCSFTKIHHYYL